MIDQAVADYIRETLRPLAAKGYITRLAGLTKVLETERFTKGRVSKFPIPVESSPNTCTGAGRTFPDLVPDDRENLIVYCESLAEPRCINGSSLWESDIRVVAWGNEDHFQSPAGNASAILFAHIVSALNNSRTGRSGPISNLKLTVSGSPVGGADLFSRYSYGELRSQYLLPPYFSFGINIHARFTLQNDCLSALTILTAGRC